MTGKDTADWKDLVRAIVNCRVCELVIVLLPVVTICKWSVNQITNPTPICSHPYTWQYALKLGLRFTLICAFVCTDHMLLEYQIFWDMFRDPLCNFNLLFASSFWNVVFSRIPDDGKSPKTNNSACCLQFPLQKLHRLWSRNGTCQHWSALRPCLHLDKVRPGTCLTVHSVSILCCWQLKIMRKVLAL
jgi:hypothetical protein